MTKYVGEQIGIRATRKGNVLLGKERKKCMEKFLSTGKHPVIEQTRAENFSSALKALPTLDVNRPHVFMDLASQRPGLSGRIVIELFEDLFPAACATFRNRCQEGHHTIQNTAIEKVQQDFAAFGGWSRRASADAFSSAQGSNRLQHVDPGLLSVHETGSHFALTLGRALALDESYLVIGRVGKGMDILDALNQVATGIEDEPEVKISIAQSGLTDHLGQNDTISTSHSVKDDAKTAKRDILTASDQVRDALQYGLKREKPDTALIGKRKKKQLGELSSEDEDDEENDDAEI